MCFFVAQNRGRYGKRSLGGGNFRQTQITSVNDLIAGKVINFTNNHAAKVFKGCVALCFGRFGDGEIQFDTL